MLKRVIVICFACVVFVAVSTQAAEWGNLTGKFVLEGAAPTPAKIKADKDPEVCSKHDLVDETIVVGKDNALEGAVVYLRTPKPDVHDSYKDSEKAEVVLDNKNCRFEPHVVVLRTTQTLLVKNSDPIGHNSKFDPLKNPGANVLIPAGGSVPQKFGQEETLPVKVGCNIHPWMGAWVVIRDNPYAAVSGADGTFKIENLPAGKELEFQLWDNLFLKNVAFKGGKTDTKGRFKLTIKAGENDLGEIKVPVSLLKK